VEGGVRLVLVHPESKDGPPALDGRMHLLQHARTALVQPDVSKAVSPKLCLRTPAS
jgi:hypothetical protein